MAFGIFGLDAPLDLAVASWKSFPYINITIFMICILFTTTLFIIRVFQTYQFHSNEAKEFGFRGISIWSHLVALFAGINFLLWDAMSYYDAFFIGEPVIPCDILQILIITSLSISRFFLYTYLLVSLYKILEIHLLFMISFIVIVCIVWIVFTVLVLTDMTFVHGLGYCWRYLTNAEWVIWYSYTIIDFLTSLFIVILFTYKFSKIKTKILSTKYCQKKKDTKFKVYHVFVNRMVLGYITVLGTIVLFVLNSLLGPLQAVIYAFDTSINCLMILLMFKENMHIYTKLCCCFIPKSLGIAYKKEINMSNQMKLRKKLEKTETTSFATSNEYT